MTRNRKQSDEPTVRAVLAYAGQLRDRADSARLRDPHVELYRPSNDAARKVSQQYGPQRALEILAGRARRAELRVEEDQARSVASRERLTNLQLIESGVRAVDRERLSLGQRLDRAILGLGLLSDTPAVRLDAEPVSLGKSSGGAPVSRRDRQLDDAVFDARRAVERLEREWEQGRRRLLEDEAA